MWVPLVENNEFNSPGADYFVKKHIDHILSVDPQIDTLILGCTHYPLLMDKIRAFLPSGITLFSQGEHVAESFLTTESAEKFSEAASIFMNTPVSVSQIEL